VSVDASKPGEFIGSFYQTCSRAHGEMVGLRIPLANLKNMTTTQLLAGLQAHLEIRELSGTNIVEKTESDIHWQEARENGVIPIFSVSPFKNGTYQAKFIVTAGASALANIPQRLEGGYMLCGLEMMPAFIGRIMGIACFVISAVVVFIVMLLVRRARKKSNFISSTTD